MIAELWKPVPNYESLYLASNLGRIQSLRTGKILSPCKTWHGYMQVCLTSENKKERSIVVHRVVAETFIPKIIDKPFINHKNGIKSDNSVSNLEWVNSQENMVHAYRTNLKRGRPGTKCNLSVLTEELVLEIRQKNKEHNIDYKELAKMYGMSKMDIWNIVKRNSWKHI